MVAVAVGRVSSQLRYLLESRAARVAYERSLVEMYQLRVRGCEWSARARARAGGQLTLMWRRTPSLNANDFLQCGHTNGRSLRCTERRCLLRFPRQTEARWCQRKSRCYWMWQRAWEWTRHVPFSPKLLEHMSHWKLLTRSCTALRVDVRGRRVGGRAGRRRSVPFVLVEIVLVGKGAGAHGALQPARGGYLGGGWAAGRRVLVEQEGNVEAGVARGLLAPGGRRLLGRHGACETGGGDEEGGRAGRQAGRRAKWATSEGAALWRRGGW